MANKKLDLRGQTALVTGASSGIGKATATALATMGAAVYLVCRNPVKGEQALEEIKQKAGHNRVFLITADLAEQVQVRRAAQEFLDTGEPLHILHNNAGITNTSLLETVDGIEETFAVNHIVPVIGGLFFRSPEKGAESSIYACTAPELEDVSGKYYANCKEKTPKPWARDVEAAKRLWRVSEEMTGICTFE